MHAEVMKKNSLTE